MTGSNNFVVAGKLNFETFKAFDTLCKLKGKPRSEAVRILIEKAILAGDI